MVLRGIRGATQLSADTAEEMNSAVGELLKKMLERNQVESDSIASILFTATSDIHSIFPATAARNLDLADVPLICAQELDITGGLPLAIRVLMQVNTDKSQREISHIFLRGAKVLRPDIATE
jgi:chorismate mutase